MIQDPCSHPRCLSSILSISFVHCAFQVIDKKIESFVQLQPAPPAPIASSAVDVSTASGGPRGAAATSTLAPLSPEPSEHLRASSDIGESDRESEAGASISDSAQQQAEIDQKLRELMSRLMNPVNASAKVATAAVDAPQPAETVSAPLAPALNGVPTFDLGALTLSEQQATVMQLMENIDWRVGCCTALLCRKKWLAVKSCVDQASECFAADSTLNSAYFSPLMIH